MSSSGMGRRVALVRTEFSEDRIASSITVTANVPSLVVRFTLMMEVTRSSETLVVTRATRRHSREEAFFIC
jgi:hypothetical protein